MIILVEQVLEQAVKYLCGSIFHTEKYIIVSYDTIIIAKSGVFVDTMLMHGFKLQKLLIKFLTASYVNFGKLILQIRVKKVKTAR